MCSDNWPTYLTREDLLALGVPEVDIDRVRRLAVEYRALDGTPCWRRDDLLEWLRLPETDEDRP